MNGILSLLRGFGSLMAAGDASFWMPAQRSTIAPEVDTLFYFIYWICVFFFALILTLAVFFIVKYRRRGDSVEVKPSAHHSTFLEVVWSGIPLILVLVVFVMGFRGFVNMRTPPKDSYEIEVTGQKWNWAFTYKNGYVDSELHVPVGEPVRLVMSSPDVLHSFFVPELRVKQDLVPGRYTEVWFEVTEPFEGVVFCAEYCGRSHSEMRSRFVAQEPEEFHAWLETASDFLSSLPPEEAGALIFQKRGCAQCHSIDGAGGVGPTFLASFGNRRSFTDGSTGAMDENYIRESLLQPRAKIVAGFDPVMPTYQGRLKEEEISVLIAYIKSLSR